MASIKTIKSVECQLHKNGAVTKLSTLSKKKDHARWSLLCGSRLVKSLDFLFLQFTSHLINLFRQLSQLNICFSFFIFGRFQ